MPKGDNRISGVKCPYYRGDKMVTIRCEGLVPGATISQHFPNKEAFWLHANGWCRGRFQACEIWQAVHNARGDGEGQ